MGVVSGGKVPGLQVIWVENSRNPQQGLAMIELTFTEFSMS